MLAILVALRDALIVLALNWVGVTLEPATKAPAEPPSASVCATDAGACARPSFNALNCAGD